MFNCYEFLPELILTALTMGDMNGYTKIIQHVCTYDMDVQVVLG